MNRYWNIQRIATIGILFVGIIGSVIAVQQVLELRKKAVNLAGIARIYLDKPASPFVSGVSQKLTLWIDLNGRKIDGVQFVMVVESAHAPEISFTPEMSDMFDVVLHDQQVSGTTKTLRFAAVTKNPIAPYTSTLPTRLGLFSIGMAIPSSATVSFSPKESKILENGTTSDILLPPTNYVFTLEPTPSKKPVSTCGWCTSGCREYPLTECSSIVPPKDTACVVEGNVCKQISYVSPITIIEPNQPETIFRGTLKKITWKGGYPNITDPPRSVALMVQKIDGTQVGWISFGNPPEGSYVWDTKRLSSSINSDFTFPTAVGNYQIRAIDYNHPAGTGISYALSKILTITDVSIQSTPSATPTPTRIPIPTVTPTVTPAPPTGVYSGLYSTMRQRYASFQFAYSGKSSWYRVHVSTTKDMSWDVYLSFAQGSTGFLEQFNPQAWDKYTCGKTLYWRVESDNGVKSPIQAAIVTCPVETPTVTPTPSRMPTVTPVPTKVLTPTPTIKQVIFPSPTPTLSPKPTSTPTPLPTPIPKLVRNNVPIVQTLYIPFGRGGKPYFAVVSAYDNDPNDTLNFTFTGLPAGIQAERCMRTTNSDRTTISCEISGTAKRAGWHIISARVSDNRGGVKNRSFHLLLFR